MIIENKLIKNKITIFFIFNYQLYLFFTEFNYEKLFYADKKLLSIAISYFLFINSKYF